MKEGERSKDLRNGSYFQYDMWYNVKKCRIGEYDMKVIPDIFSDESEGYITLPALKKFAKEKSKSDLRTTVNRPEIIADINSYAIASERNKKIVLNWIDSVLKEGIKDLYIKRLNLSEEQIVYLKDDKKLVQDLENQLFNPECKHLINSYCRELRTFRYEINQTEHGRAIVLYMGKLVCCHNKEGGTRVVPYPLVVEIYVDRSIIVGRGKAKSNIYTYDDPFILEIADTTTTEKEIFNAINYVLKIFGISTQKGVQVTENFRGMLYKMLERYTQTPDEIVDLMHENIDEINNIRDLIVDDICCLTPHYSKDVLADVTNMIEKYFSISYADKKIFTNNRDAYPLRISATDEEESKLDQKAVNEDPLQSKAVFFDNKKLLQKSKLCDGVWFRFFRISTLYCTKAFNIKVSVKKDYCCIKFTEYTMEEDIKYVLFSFINS